MEKPATYILLIVIFTVLRSLKTSFMTINVASFEFFHEQYVIFYNSNVIVKVIIFSIYLKNDMHFITRNLV